VEAIDHAIMKPSTLPCSNRIKPACGEIAGASVEGKLDQPGSGNQDRATRIGLSGNATGRDLPLW